MPLSALLTRFKDVPHLVEKAKTAASASEPAFRSLIGVYNQYATAFNLRPIASGSTTDMIMDVVSRLRAIRGRVESSSLRVNRAIAETMVVGESGETPHDTADRLHDDPTMLGRIGYFDTVNRDVEEVKYAFDNIALTDVSKQLPVLHPERRVQAVNGGTIDVYAVNGAMGAAAGSVHTSTAASTYVYAVNGFDSSISSISSANAIESVWVKTGSGARSVSTSFYHDGTNDFTADPTITVTIPSGVPSGRLRVIGYRKPTAGLYVSNPGAGADLASQSGFDTDGASLAVSDASNSYWTWSDGSGNEEFSFSRFVSKGTADNTSIVITQTLTATASVLFTTVLEFEYYPSDVALSDLDTMNVDIATADPLSRAVEIILLYDTWCDNHNIPTFLDTLNSRLNTSYLESVLYPQNWNTFVFDVSFREFLDAYIEVYSSRRDMISRDVGFLETM